MLKLKRRAPKYPLWDAGPFTLVLCDGGFYGNGTHCWPKLTLILRDRWTRSNGRDGRAVIARRVSVPMPYVRWGINPLRSRLNRGFVQAYYKLLG
jgi:hypothetical protein